MDHWMVLSVTVLLRKRFPMTQQSQEMKLRYTHTQLPDPPLHAGQFLDF